jgi:hypothetical protein
MLEGDQVVLTKPVFKPKYWHSLISVHSTCHYPAMLHKKNVSCAPGLNSNYLLLQDRPPFTRLQKADMLQLHDSSPPYAWKTIGGPVPDRNSFPGLSAS